jgi:short-subunit dehydrogenase
MRKMLIFGAASAIAEATARRFAAEGAAFFLAGRDESRLEAIAADLRVRGAARADWAVSEALDFDGHRRLVEEAAGRLGGLDTVLVAHGTLPDQKACQRSFDRTHREISVNALGTLSVLTHGANWLERQGFGTLCAIGSPAGDRGRQSNYVYGTAKAAVAVFLQGLRNRLHPSGVHVVTVKPGFTDTPMTAGFSKGPLWAKPEAVAAGIHRAIVRRKDVVYVPGFWGPVMALIRAVPEGLFKRLRL